MDSESSGPSPEDMGLSEGDMKPSEEEPNKSNMPGGVVSSKPLEIGGQFYGLGEEPHLLTHPDGKEEYIGGKVKNKDEAFSEMFWSREQPDGMREAMLDGLQSAIDKGKFGTFVGVGEEQEGKTVLDQESKERLSAYRVLAREQGYTIGEFEYHKVSGTAMASVLKTETPKNQSGS